MPETHHILAELRDIASKELAITLCLPGFDVDATYTPVPTPADDAADRSADESRYIIRGTVDSSHVDSLWQHPNIADLYMDSEIAPFPVSLESLVANDEIADVSDCAAEDRDCDPSQPRGSLADVAAYLGVPWLWADGVRGDDVVVGIVDGGIAARQRCSRNQADTIDRVVGGWPRADWGTVCRWGHHGNMSATHVLGLAPRANIYDIRISDATNVAGRISDALAGYQWAIDRFRRDGTPQILSNSWGMHRAGWGPVYAADSSHPFTRKVVEAIDNGILVLFAAGDCGDVCPSRECGTDVGPGHGIWGANGHPRVMTVGGANLEEQLVGYSSQGPAVLDDHKPDFCGITHFTGYSRSDSGTSAACSVVAGVVALLKQAQPSLTQEDTKRVLQDSAKPIGSEVWNTSSGAGIIQAKAAHEKLTTV